MLITKKTPISRNKIAKLSNAATKKPMQSKPAADPTQVEINTLRTRVDTLEAQIALLISTIQINTAGDVVIQSANDITMNASNNININGNAKVNLSSGNQASSVKLNSNGNLILTSSIKATINTSTINFSASLLQGNVAMVSDIGVLKCNTLIADTVTGKSYTPGLGNLW